MEDSLRGIAAATATDCQRDKYLQLIMERGRNVGPWLEEVWVVPTADGVTIDLEQATLVRSSAAVPEVIVHDERFWLFYGEGDMGMGFELASEGSDWFSTHGLIAFGALNLLVSDDGVNFELVDDFAVEGLVPGMVVDPDVIRTPDGRFRLYYVALTIDELEDDSTWDEDAQHDVYYAESDDLIHWKQVGVAVHGPIADPSVLCMTETRCRMFSTGMDHSHSTDGGATFTFDGATRVKAFAPEFLQVGETLRQYYNSMELGGPLKMRESHDGGKTWREPQEVVPAFQVEAPSFAPNPSGEGWLMYYHYYMEEYRDIYPARPDDGAQAPEVPKQGGPQEP